MTTTKPTGKQITKFLARLTPGVQVEHVHNAFIPDRDGLRTVVERGGKTSIKLRALNSRGNIAEGEDYWMSPPAKVGEWVSIDGDEATYLVRGEHPSTVRIVQP